MPTLKIPAMAIYHSGLKPEYYMAERLKAAGASIEINGNEIKRTGKIFEQEDPEKKNIIFSWEDADKKNGCPVFPGCGNKEGLK